MELPVQFNTIAEEQIKDEMMLMNKQPYCENTLENTFNRELVLNNVTEELKKDLVMKKWIQTICWEKEMLERELTHRNFNVEVDRTRRIVVVKVLTPCKTATLFQKVIRVPENVTIQHLKVRCMPEQKILLIKAPFTNYNTFPEVMTTTGRTFEEELTMERMLEVEPTLYKMVQQMRQHLPALFVPRVIRHLETGLLKVVLDLACDRAEQCRNAEDILRVQVNELERCLDIKVLCEKLFHTRCCEQQQLEAVPCHFQPREMCHKFMLPTFINLAKVNHFPLCDKKVIRIELPVIREQLRTGLYNNNNCCNTNKWTRCL